MPTLLFLLVPCYFKVGLKCDFLGGPVALPEVVLKALGSLPLPICAYHSYSCLCINTCIFSCANVRLMSGMIVYSRVPWYV